VRKYLLPALLLIYACRAPAGVPHVTVAYNPGLDSTCSIFRGGAIKDEWKAELVLRKPEFERLWAAVGPKLIETTEAITGKPFPSGDITAWLMLCDLPSQSFVGISINMRRALASFTSPPVPMRYKVDVLFHELLHGFLDEHPVHNSALLGQHASEPSRVRNHLHLLALQKAVLLKLGETEALRDIVAIDSQLPGGYYKRAWALVNATDSEYLKYVAEISK
jgi:hypothetical protein